MDASNGCNFTCQSFFPIIMKKSLLITSGANESPFPFRRESWGEEYLRDFSRYCIRDMKRVPRWSTNWAAINNRRTIRTWNATYRRSSRFVSPSFSLISLRRLPSFLPSFSHSPGFPFQNTGSMERSTPRLTGRLLVQSEKSVELST